MDSDLIAKLSSLDCEVRGCKKTLSLDQYVIPATEEDWSTEYLAPIISIKVVDDAEEAIQHINSYGTGHTESIISEDLNLKINLQPRSIVQSL